MKRTIILMLTLTLIWTACSENSMEPDYHEEIVVSAYLFTGQPIDSVRLTRTFDIKARYNADDAAVSGADVTISDDENVYQLSEYSNVKGVYYLLDRSVRVQPDITYTLNVEYGNHKLMATTTAPAPIEITHLPADTLTFLDLEQKFSLEWSGGEGSEGYWITTVATPHPSSPYSERLVDFQEPAIVDFQLAQFDGDTLEAFSPVSGHGMDGVMGTSADLPWFMFSWYGEYQLTLYAVEQEYLDVLTSMNQTDTFEDPLYNVFGGLGLFTAVSADTVQLYVKR